MRIALIAHVRHPIAPPFMGGMEAHSWHLARALAAQGHQVTLFASGDSAPHLPPGVTLFPILDQHYDAAFPWHRYRGTKALNDHVDAGFARACAAIRDGNFDVVHNNALHRYPPRLARVHRLPMVTSLHIPPFPVLHRAVMGSGAPWNRFTVTSARQADIWWPGGAPNTVSVVYNGIEPADWPYVPTGDGSAIWAGRITATKGTALAAAAAKAAGMPLSIYGTIENQDYFDTDVKPLLGPDIRYRGHVAGADLARAYGRASVLLFTPLWEEPFGLAAIEAMATGLPIAATDLGAVREVVGPAGTYAPRPTPDALARALRAARGIPPHIPHTRVQTHFTLDRMVAAYGAQYDLAQAGLARHLPPLSMTQTQLSIGA